MEDILSVIIEGISQLIPELGINTKHKWLNSIIEILWNFLVVMLIGSLLVIFCLGVYWLLKEAILK